MKQIAIQKFLTQIYDYYRQHGRTFPWRRTKNPYRIFISELMLQQTQTSTVLPKYQEFIKAFPDFEALAMAPLSQILTYWQGLGYNRRALYLKQAAQKVITDFGGKLPRDIDALDSLPGVGPYSAAAIAAFAYNIPTAFIETNIRRVFLHFFFPKHTSVHDKKLLPVIEKYLDRKNPREWYYALMDYGAMLKRTTKNPNRRSAHYTIQSKFEGSDRQIRGKILRLLLTRKRLDKSQLCTQLNEPMDRVHRVLIGLQKDGVIIKKKEIFQIA